MSTLELLQSNLLSPVVLFFVLGAVATLVKSDLELPDPFVKAMSIYLLMAIGLKGGVALSEASFGVLLKPLGATIVLGLSIPLVAYVTCRRVGRLTVEDSAALAAHYGSCSVVTFIAATTFLAAVGSPAEGFLPALVAVMEVPAIVVALVIARVRSSQTGSMHDVLRETLSGRSVLLLIGGMIIGTIVGKKGFAQVDIVFVDAFKGVLCVYMLELGTKAAARLVDLKKTGPFLVAFAVLMPLAAGFAGVYLGHLSGLSVGGATALGVLSASASYIAAPAAVRIALPTANPALYLTASLAVTFPFNLTLGIPLYYKIAQAIH